jgi:hypothetical protein
MLARTKFKRTLDALLGASSSISRSMRGRRVVKEREM